MAVGPCFFFFEYGWKQEHFGWTSLFLNIGMMEVYKMRWSFWRKKCMWGKSLWKKTTCRDCDVQKIILIFLDLRIQKRVLRCFNMKFNFAALIVFEAFERITLAYRKGQTSNLGKKTFIHTWKSCFGYILPKVERLEPKHDGFFLFRNLLFHAIFQANPPRKTPTQPVSSFHP